MLATGPTTTEGDTAGAVESTGVRVAFLAVRLVALAETLDLVPRSSESGVDRTQIAAALDAFGRLGIGRTSATLGPDVTPAMLARVLDDMLVAVEESPLPQHEWGPLTRLFGDEVVAARVGTSISSVQRYRGGERETPDDVATRLHTIALITADLAGSYNEIGIRRWFQRPRTALDGAAPSEILAGDWSPDEESVVRVRSLARALVDAPAT